MIKALPSTLQIGVVIPNWNSVESLAACIDSLSHQTLQPHIIMVDNGSTDGSVELVTQKYPQVEIIRHTTNKGYAGGVNPGFRLALERDYDYVAPFNNDAVADKQWLQRLATFLHNNSSYGIAACKLLSADGDHLDSSGECYTTWGLPYPRGRNETNIDKYDNSTEIFAASGGASLYRVSMLREIGLLDEDFFAYYEDVDLSFRAQLADWKIVYVPASRVYHATSTTGSRIKGFFTEQTMKNLPMLLWKNVPRAYLPMILPRFTLVYLAFFASAIQRGQLTYAIKGSWRAFTLWPKKHGERRHIQAGKKVTDAYIGNMLTYDLPPNAAKLRKLRASWRKLQGKRD